MNKLQFNLLIIKFNIIYYFYIILVNFLLFFKFIKIILYFKIKIC